MYVAKTEMARQCSWRRLYTVVWESEKGPIENVNFGRIWELQRVHALRGFWVDNRGLFANAPPPLLVLVVVEWPIMCDWLYCQSKHLRGDEMFILFLRIHNKTCGLYLLWRNVNFYYLLFLLFESIFFSTFCEINLWIYSKTRLKYKFVFSLSTQCAA